MSEEIACELVKFLLCRLREREMAVSHTGIQNAAFRIRMELGCGHPLYESLPFYWCERGPFSDVVAQAFFKLRDENCCRFSSGSYLLDDSSYEVFSSDNALVREFPEIEVISIVMFRGKNSFFNRFEEEIYIDYAPFAFMHPFRFILLDMAMNDEGFYSMVPERYLDVYHDCLLQMPHDEMFNRFSVLFSRIFTRLELLNDENMFIDCWEYVRAPILLSWLAFSKAISIGFHDSFYDGDVDAWKIDFDDRMERLKRSINCLEEKTDYMLDGSLKSDLDPFEERIFNATLGNYLMG